MHLISEMIHPSLESIDGNVFRRQAARGVVLRDESILLLFTERYNDFSFPGGGVGLDEDLVAGLQREMQEETGAREITVLRHYGRVEEYRPYWKADYDLMHMTSHFYICEIAEQLGETRMEAHELANGMRPLWIKINEAISHNQAVMARQEVSMGQSIHRETMMLEKIQRELVLGETLDD